MVRGFTVSWGGTKAGRRFQFQLGQCLNLVYHTTSWKECPFSFDLYTGQVDTRYFVQCSGLVPPQFTHNERVSFFVTWMLDEGSAVHGCLMRAQPFHKSASWNYSSIVNTHAHVVVLSGFLHRWYYLWCLPISFFIRNTGPITICISVPCIGWGFPHGFWCSSYRGCHIVSIHVIYSNK